MKPSLSGRLQIGVFELLLEHGQLDATTLGRLLQSKGNATYHAVKRMANIGLVSIGKSSRTEGRKRTVYGLTKLGIEHAIELEIQASIN